MDHATKPTLATPEAALSHLPEAGGDFLAFPLTPAQAAMWRADQSWPGCSLFNASFRWSLTGRLDRVLLQRAFNEVVRRHEILRATFAEENNGLVQLISPALEIKIVHQDLRALPAPQRDAEMEAISTLEAKRGFDLAHGPLLRVGLLQMEDQRHVLTLTLHHIVIDGWSVSLLMEELQAIYTAYAAGQESPLPEPAIQFGDYVVWHQEWIASAEIRQQLDYWTKKLAGYRRLDVAADLRKSGRAPDQQPDHLPDAARRTDRCAAEI